MSPAILRSLLLCCILFLSGQGLIWAQSTTPNAHFDHVRHDFGDIIRGGLRTYTFTFENRGTEPVQVDAVKSGCGCVTADWSPAPIAPGEKGILKITFNTADKLGPQQRNIEVFLRGQMEPIRLSIEGNVLMEDGLPAIDSDVKPQAIEGRAQRIEEDAKSSSTLAFNALEIDLGTLEEGQLGEYAFTFQNHNAFDVRVDDLQVGCKCMKVRTANRAISPNEIGTIEVAFDSRGMLGKQVQTIQVFFQHGEPASVLLTVKADVVKRSQ